MPQDASQLEFGWFLPGGGVPEKDRLPLLSLEASGMLPVVAEHFDSIWVPDHFYGFAEPTDAWMECWTALTWLAARYPWVRVGPIVLGVGYRNPALLAKMAATLQTLSGGRFVMGIGAGWRSAEYKAYSYDFPSAAVRIKQLEEAVQIMRLMWTGSAPTFEGKYFQIENAYAEPRPTPPPPVMIGGSGEKLLLPLAARISDIWDRYHGGPLQDIDLEEYGRKVDIVRTHAGEAGRAPGAIKQSFTIENGTLPESRQDSEDWVAALRPLLGLGVRQFIVGFGRVTDPAPVRRFVEEVIVPLRQG
jgi:alkanesulfonate monooxygenase SsuD/methylene tetrahydromethanopterin reductase-like flavin-dependent oxidoreductase (luciferase family)